MLDGFPSIMLNCLNAFDIQLDIPPCVIYICLVSINWVLMRKGRSYMNKINNLLSLQI